MSILAAVLAAAAPSFGQDAGQAQFGQPPSPPCSACLSAPPNTIYLDASGGKLMHPLAPIREMKRPGVAAGP